MASKIASGRLATGAVEALFGVGALRIRGNYE